MQIVCPRCGGTDISPVGATHYVCNNKKCTDVQGGRTQFLLTYDRTVRFPYNQIFVGRPKSEFYKMSYLQIKPTERVAVQ